MRAVVHEHNGHEVWRRIRVGSCHDQADAGCGKKIGVEARSTAIVQELEAPIGRVAARFIPTPAAAALEAQIYPSAARVVAAAQQALNKTSARG